MKAWDPTASLPAAINHCRCTIITATHTDSALVAISPQHFSVGVVTPTVVCIICNQLIPQGDADKNGTMHQNCATLKRGKVYTCGMCGEDILQTGNDKVHENCRSIRAAMGEGEAKRYLHEAVAQRVKKREGFFCLPPCKMSKSEDHRPPLPPPSQVPPSQGPVADDYSTDEETLLLQSPTSPPSTALAERADALADILTEPDNENARHPCKVWRDLAARMPVLDFLCPHCGRSAEDLPSQRVQEGFEYGCPVHGPDVDLIEVECGIVE